MGSLLDDAACVRVLVDLMDWAAADPLVSRVADASRVYLVGGWVAPHPTHPPARGSGPPLGGQASLTLALRVPDASLPRSLLACRAPRPGHSRGGKLSALAGAEDARVAALCLLDPVDNTAYAPLAPG